MATVYLAGGTKSGWQQRVIDACPQHTFINPCDRNGVALLGEREYTAWDLAGVKQADIVFAYMESDNPSGIGMAAEMGYGHGLGKTVVFINESANRYFKFVEAMSDVCFPTLNSGILFLQSVTW